MYKGLKTKLVREGDTSFVLVLKMRSVFHFISALESEGAASPFFSLHSAPLFSVFNLQPEGDPLRAGVFTVGLQKIGKEEDKKKKKIK